MSKKFLNQSTISGLLYDHKLEERVTGANSKNPGTSYITGTISVATDDAITNIIDVHYSYVVPATKSGAENKNYVALKNIINGAYKTVMMSGKDNATKLSINSQIALNEFYSDRSGKKELVSVKRNEGGFINVVSTLNPDESKRNTFAVDMVITTVTHTDADDERDVPEKAIVKGYIFDEFRKACLPVEFSAVRPDAISYFEGLEANTKNPVFTYIKGNQVSEVVKKTLTYEGAFGNEVREVTNTRKDFVINWAASEPYLFDDESTITKQELKDMLAAREVLKSDLEARFDARTTVTTVQSDAKLNLTAATDDFDF